MGDAIATEFVLLQQAVIGRYSLEREIGRGGMGIVFLARDVALDRPVAIKLLPPALAAKPGLRERFLREARTAAKLSQPHIVPIHSVEESGALVFFVMAYIEGETLGERLRARGPLTPHEGARLLQEVAWALGYAHKSGVVHRDIKPDNIMIERASGRAIVMDFGIAGAADQGGGEVFGTAQYISPEQANGAPVDGRSDLYSLGVVAFLALSGRLPFDADDVAGILAQHITRPAPRLGSVAAGLPRKLAQAVDRCLAKDPTDRFPDGESLAEAAAQSVEVKRQLPMPVRLWLTADEKDRNAYVLLWFGILGPGAATLAYWFTTSVLGTDALLALLAMVGAAFGIPPIVFQALRRLLLYRRLLESGYTLDDAKLAVREVAERRREELAYEYGDKPPLWARVDRWLMITAGTAFVSTIIGTVAVGVVTASVPFTLAMSIAASGLTWFATALLQVVRPGRSITKDESAERRLWFWNSRLGKWFDKLAKIALKKKAKPVELTYRPTEMAIGLAADALFESLPKEQRREFKELPGVLERLQKDAAAMRQAVDELNSALALVGDAADAEQSTLRAELVERRDEASRRLADAVAALEKVRLGLLRLKAGTGTTGELTADLSEARAINQQLQHAGDAQLEVEAFLRANRPRLRTLRDAVTPV